MSADPGRRTALRGAAAAGIAAAGGTPLLGGCAALARATGPDDRAASLVLPMARTPESVGLSSVQLQRLADATRAHVVSGVLPGAVMLVARRGRVAWFETVGFRDRASGAPMHHDAIFRIYSMTKPIVSIALMMLVEEGRLQVSDPASRYLPALRGMRLGVERKDAAGNATVELVEPPHEMTVQDLLRHTSGLTYGARARGTVAEQIRAARLGDRNETNEAFVAKLARTPLLYAPGTRWEYGVSTDVVGRLVEVLSQRTLGEFLQQRIFAPLGMEDTAFWVTPDKLGRAAQPWARPGTTATPRFDVALKPTFESGGGGLTSTAADYLRFATMLLNGGALEGTRIVGSKTLQFMTADHVGNLPGRPPGLGFGLGFEVRTRLGPSGIAGSVGEYGWAGNAGTLFWVDPAEQLIALYMVQVDDGERVALRNQFRAMVQAAIVG